MINEVFRILWKGTDMKAKWVKAAGLLAAGSLVFSAAYIDGKPGVKDTQEVMAESTDSQIHEVSAGVSSTLAEQMENYTKQGTDLASGVTDVMSDYLSVTAADMVSVSESDRDMTASGQEDETQTEEDRHRRLQRQPVHLDTQIWESHRQMAILMSVKFREQRQRLLESCQTMQDVRLSEQMVTGHRSSPEK